MYDQNVELLTSLYEPVSQDVDHVSDANVVLAKQTH